MSSKIKIEDKELILTNKSFDYSSDENLYFGGYFGNDSGDYVEALIYDTSDNLLEASIVDSSDHYYDSDKGGVKLKTGTILRKLGYDRGKFKVTYNFLRKVAGSYETLLTDDNDEIFNGEFDINQIDNDLFIKENKYIIHKISPSRTEVRLIAQNIRDEKYIRDFYKLAARNKKVTADTSIASNIEFVAKTDGTGKETSNKLRFVTPPEGEDVGLFKESMKGGTISIPNFFEVGKIFPPTRPALGDLGLGTTETIGRVDSDGVDVYQASFFLDEGAGTKEFKENANGVEGDTKFSQAYFRFKDTTSDAILTAAESDGVDFKGDGKTLDDVTNLHDSQFDCVYLKRKDPNPVIDIVSNSFLRADADTEYIWEVTGFDKDGGSYDRIRPRPLGEDEGGDFQIVTVTGTTYAIPDVQSPFRAIQTVNSTGGEAPPVSRAGSRLKLKLFSTDVHIGIQLSIKNNISLQTSTIHLPAIIETH